MVWLDDESIDGRVGYAPLAFSLICIELKPPLDVSFWM
jgi:hypothetical protein